MGKSQRDQIRNKMTGRSTIILTAVSAAALAVFGLFVWFVVTQSPLMSEPDTTSISTMPQNEPESREPLPKISKPRLVIKKAERTLELLDGDKTIRTYRIALGSTPVGDKEIEGDGKTPEGDFYIFGKNPNSKYFLSLGISYPSAEDADRGERTGLLTIDQAQEIRSAIAEVRTPPQKTNLGGEIYIHGGGIRSDWTEGCIAMTNDDIRELFDNLHKGVPVSILP